MDEACLQHRLTDEERRQFDSQGFLIVPGVLPEAKVAALVEAADRIDANWRPKRELKPHQPLNILDAFGMDDEFLDLLDLPATFMKVVDILGWHIQLYHSHLIVTPAFAVGVRAAPTQAWLAPGQRTPQQSSLKASACARIAQGRVLPHQHAGTETGETSTLFRAATS